MSKAKVVILSIVHQGLSVTEAAAVHGYSRTHIYRLLERYNTGGIDAVEPRPPIAKSQPHKTPEPLREKIIELRTSLTEMGLDAGPISLQWYLQREGLPAPSTSTIRRILHQAGLIVAQPQEKPKSATLRFEAAQPNETWQSDVVHWYLENGTRIEILGWLDDHSRFLLSSTCHHSVTGQRVVDDFTKLISTFGPPYSTLTDNGQIFTSRSTGGKNAFEYLLAKHGIRQKNGRKNHPQTQGKIERFHQTLKQWLRAKPRPETLQELQQQLDQLRHHYNHTRPHRSLGGKTPHEAYESGIKATPDQPPITHAWRIRHDHVDKDGKVSLRRAGKMHHLGVGRTHRHTPVLILVDKTSVTITNEQTGELLSQHQIDENKSYWRNQLRPPGRWPTEQKRHPRRDSSVT